jgi:hypothetical protein
MIDLFLAIFTTIGLFLLASYRPGKVIDHDFEEKHPRNESGKFTHKLKIRYWGDYDC